MLASCAGSRPEAAVAEPMAEVPDDKRAVIEGVLEQYRQAYEIAGIEALAELYSQDLDLVLVYQGQKHQGWTAVSEYLVKRLAGATTVRMSMKDVVIHEVGDVGALVTATRETSMGDGSVTVTDRGVLTLVLRNQDGRWMVVAEHFSYPTSRS